VFAKWVLTFPGSCFAGSELTFDYDMEFYGSEDVKCLCGAPKCRGTLGKKADECDKGKSKISKAASTAARKSGEGGSSKKPGAQAVSSSREGKKQMDKSANRCGGAAEVGKNAGVKRKQEIDEEGDHDDFFSSLPPRERKRQMEMMKKVMGGGK